MGRAIGESPLLFIALMTINIVSFGESFADVVDIGIGAINSVLHLFGMFAETAILCYLFGGLKHKKTKVTVWFIVISASLLIAISDIFLIGNFGNTLNKAMIAILLETNPASVFEFAKAYLLPEKLDLGIAVPLSMMSFFIAIFVLSYRTVDRIEGVSIEIGRRIGSIIEIPRSKRIVSLLFTGGLIVSFVSILVPSIPSHISIVRVPIQLCAAVDMLGNEEKVIEAMDMRSERVTEDNSDIPCVVFILGESADRNHMGCYGYPLNNTPFMWEEIRRENVYLFTDTIACGNTTGDVMKLMFTFGEKGQEESYYEKGNLFDILRQTDYRTAWISNQTSVSLYGNMDKIYSGRCDESRFTEIHGSYGRGISREYDEALLPMFDSFLESGEEGEKNFCLLHTEGSHEIYRLRYPEGFRKFTADDEPVSKREWQNVQAEYDNSILYGDWFFHEVISRFEDREAVVIYVSDHGNEVYDGRDFMGHSMENEGNRHMIEVPLAIWVSPSFKDNHPDLCRRMRESTDRPFRTDDMIYLVLDLMDIRTNSFDPRRSPINAEYDSDRPRIYNGVPYHRST